MTALRGERVRDMIRRKIEAGEWGPGSRVPTEAELTREFGVSRGTVRKVLEKLVASGELERRANVGCFVSQGSGEDSFRSGLVAYLESNTSGNLSGNLQLRGAELEAQEYGLDLIYCNLNGHLERTREIIDRLVRRNCRNVIFAPEICKDYCETNSPVLDLLEAAKISYVVVGSPLAREGVIRGDFVGSDNYGVMRNVVRQLMEAGHRRIGSIRVFDGVFSSDQRLAGILDQLRLDGLSTDPAYHRSIRNVPLEEQGRECLRALMALPEPPTAIICTHDALAANTIDELRKLKLSVPGDVSLFGVDDSFLARALQLSSIRLPFVEIGKRAMRILFEKRFGGESMRRQEFLPCRIINRKSVAHLF